MIGKSLNEKGFKTFKAMGILKLFFALIFVLLGTASQAQNVDIEQLRKKGFEAKTNGDLEMAIGHYKNILELEAEDYDAWLAIARLCFLQEDYKNSMHYFEIIYANDSTDVEALKGLGDCYLYLDKPGQACGYYKKAISYLPSYVPLYFQLAKAYSWQGQLKKAIKIYEDVLVIDNTYSEAWQGIGKMLNWQRKPKSALPYYERAMELDPATISIADEYREVKKQLDYQISASLKILNETEESYEINALVQEYRFQKRLGDHFNVSANFLLDHSDRDFTNPKDADTIRWYDNSWAKIGWLGEHHKINVFGGYSQSDKKFSSYGIHWQWGFSINSVNFSNSFNAGYDYFYYWNQVGHHVFSDKLSIKYKKFTFDAGYGFGIVDSAEIRNIVKDSYGVDVNNHNEYAFSLSYKLLQNPKIIVAANYSYLDFDNKSSLYYSPYERKLWGPSASIYWPLKHFYFYASFSYNTGIEFYYDVKGSGFVKNYLDVDNWSAGSELGYNLNKLSFSLSGSRFYNPFYSNYAILATIKLYL
jgi:tetratricopeptide (TPR) repeat protein